VKRVFNPPQVLFRKPLCNIIYLRSSKVMRNNETYNVLTLGCLTHFEPNTIMLLPLKPIRKLRFSFNIMP
jgi:hypothetical protein